MKKNLSSWSPTSACCWKSFPKNSADPTPLVSVRCTEWFKVLANKENRRKICMVSPTWNLYCKGKGFAGQEYVNCFKQCTWRASTSRKGKCHHLLSYRRPRQVQQLHIHQQFHIFLTSFIDVSFLSLKVKFPDFSLNLKKFQFPWLFLTRGNHVSYNQTCFNKLYIICLILSSSLTGFIHLGTYIKKICLPYLQIISLNFFF